MKFLVVVAQLETSSCTLANCAALSAVLFTSLTENLRLCASAEAGLFLKIEQK